MSTKLADCGPPERLRCFPIPQPSILAMNSEQENMYSILRSVVRLMQAFQPLMSNSNDLQRPAGLAEILMVCEVSVNRGGFSQQVPQWNWRCKS